MKIHSVRGEFFIWFFRNSDILIKIYPSIPPYEYDRVGRLWKSGTQSLNCYTSRDKYRSTKTCDQNLGWFWSNHRSQKNKRSNHGTLYSWITDRKTNSLSGKLSTKTNWVIYEWISLYLTSPRWWERDSRNSWSKCTRWGEITIICTSMSLFSSLDTLESPINRSLQSLDGTYLDGFFAWVSNIPVMLIGFFILIVVLIFRKHSIWKALIVSLIISLAIHFLINEWFFKWVLTWFDIFRPRPYTVHSDILAIGHPFADSSFPSSHMAFTTLMVVILSHFERRILPYGVTLIVLMGLSRIHNGMHYPSDVLIGIIMGMIYGSLGLYGIARLWLEKKPWWKRFFWK